MSDVFWLASYPKSGNTWIRALLTNLLRPGEAPASINALVAPNVSLRSFFDRVTGLDSGYLSPGTVAVLRPQLHARLAGEPGSTPRLYKVHDAWDGDVGGRPLFPFAGTAGVVYIVRHPVDVAASFAHHSATSHEEVVRRMASGDACLAPGGEGVPNQLVQRLSSWSGHVRSWTRDSGLSVHLVRYEAVHADPAGELESLAGFLGADVTREAVTRAVELSRFDLLEAQEARDGYREGSLQADRFFRQGRVGSGFDELPPSLVRSIGNAHGGVMAELGYHPRRPGLTTAAPP